MNWIDIIFSVVLLIGIILGVYTGFWWQFIRFFLLLVALYSTLYLHEPIAKWIGPEMADPYMAQLLIYLVVFTSIYLILFMITWVMEITFGKKSKGEKKSKESKGDKKPKESDEPKESKGGGKGKSGKSTLNRAFGGLFGFMKTALICGSILLGVSYYPTSQLRAQVKESAFAKPLLWYTRKVALFMPHKYKQNIRSFIDSITRQQKAPETEGR
ncbi:MAG: CvpA family protein [Candidatus Brocadiia bacterium]